MSSIDGIDGDEKPEKIKAYKQDFHDSVGVFRNALKEYSKTDKSFYAKQGTLKDSMSESNEVIGQLSPMFSEDIQKQKTQLDHDYNTFNKDDSAQNIKKLQEDLNNLDQSI